MPVGSDRRCCDCEIDLGQRRGRLARVVGVLAVMVGVLAVPLLVAWTGDLWQSLSGAAMATMPVLGLGGGYIALAQRRFLRERRCSEPLLDGATLQIRPMSADDLPRRRRLERRHHDPPRAPIYQRTYGH